jgi:Caspase domain
MDKSATRKAILATFRKHLTTNDNITEGNTIIFYYAGHGSRVTAPNGWAATNGRIETLCPYDDGMIDENGEAIHGIPDRTINLLLRELAAIKGDNIVRLTAFHPSAAADIHCPFFQTVIIDCCHAGEMRCETSNKIPLTARFVETPSQTIISPSLDSNILDTGTAQAIEATIPAGFRHKAMLSHVLLAACCQHQCAHEVTTADGTPCGFFTDNLLKQLRIVDLERVTYADLLNPLPELINQKPQCEGVNKTRYLFDGKMSAMDPKAFKLVEAGGHITVCIGSIQGVVVGTEFAVHGLDSTPSSPVILGTLVALSVGLDSSKLNLCPGADKFDIPEGAMAVVSDWKYNAFPLKVAVELGAEDRLARALFPDRDITQGDQVQGSGIVQVLGRANADIVVKRKSATTEILCIERLDSLIPKYAGVITQFDPVNKLNHFGCIFHAIAQFNYHLARHRADDPFEQRVSLELFRLSKQSGSSEWVPDEGVGNLLGNNDARVQADEEARYGLAITNRSRHDLFPYLFYFDPSDYSILVRSFLWPAVRYADLCHS